MAIKNQVTDCGLIYTAEEEKPGLSVFPAIDEEVHSIHPVAESSVMACMNCGNTISASDEEKPGPVCLTEPDQARWVALQGAVHPRQRE